MAAIEWWIYVLSAYELIHLCKSSDRLGPDKTELLLSRTNRPSIRYLISLYYSSLHNTECYSTVSSSAERGIMCDKILSPDTLNVDMGDFV